MIDRTRAWSRMTSTEHIVAMSLATGGVIAIVNSTVWALVVCFISYQRARVRLAQAQAVAFGYDQELPAAPPLLSADVAER